MSDSSRLPTASPFAKNAIVLGLLPVGLGFLHYAIGADFGVRASVFHQKKDPAGQWSEAPVDANTATDLENAILTRARQIRLSAVANQQ